MLKKVGFLTLVFLLAFAFSASAENKLIADSLKNQKPITMTIAHPEPPDPLNFIHSSALAFKGYVETVSEGKITVKLAPGGQLGDSAEMPKQIQMGAIEGSMSMAEGHIAPYYKGIQVLAIPYLFVSVDHALYTLDVDRPFGKKLWADLENKTGLKVLTIWDNGGFRCFTNNKRPIHTPDDMKGLKIRTMQIPAHMEMVKALGANPTPIAWTELPNALSTGVVDGQENPVGVIYNNKLYEVQKYLILDGHAYGADFMLINDKFFNSLSAEQQNIIKTAAIVAGNVGRGIQELNSAMGISELKKEGMQVYSPTSKERMEFKEKTQGPVIDWMKTQVDPQWIDKVMAATKKAEAELK